MSLKHGLLGLLGYGDMTGYELTKYFNESLNFFWSAQTSQIYRDLNNLEKKGFLKSKIEHQEGKPDKRIYSITKEGKDEFLKWLNDYDFGKELDYRDPMLMKMFFSKQGDTEKLIRGLEDFIKDNSYFLEAMKITKQHINDNSYAEHEQYEDDKIYWKLCILRGEYLSKANIEWAEESIQLLKEIKR